MTNRIDSACWYRVWDRKTTKYGEWLSGRLRMWSTDYEEYDSGPALFPAAVIEDDKSMMCHSVPVHDVCFASVPPRS